MDTKGQNGDFSMAVVEDVPENEIINDMVGTGTDAKDMHRMGKTQQLRVSRHRSTKI